jgi:hypothetical protein
MSTVDETQETRDPILMALHDVWLKLAAARGSPPTRAAIDPVNIPPRSLPHVVLIDVEPGPRFRFRLVGTYTAHGVDPTGSYLDEAAPDGPYREHILEMYRSPLDLGGPSYTITHYLSAGGIFNRSTHRIFMPLSSDGTTVDGLFVGQRTQDGKPYQGSLWELVPNMIKVVRKERLDAS